LKEELRNLAKELDDVVLHPKRFIILTLLYLSGPLTEGELKSAVNVSWGALTTHLRRLEEHGLIKRRKWLTKSLKLRVFVYLTEKGIQQYIKAIKSLEKILKCIQNSHQK